MNVATECGFTPQYAGLETLHNVPGPGLPRSSASRATSSPARSPAARPRSPSSASATFGVTFPLTVKANVRGKNQHPLYAELSKAKTAEAWAAG